MNMLQISYGYFESGVRGQNFEQFKSLAHKFLIDPRTARSDYGLQVSVKNFAN